MAEPSIRRSTFPQTNGRREGIGVFGIDPFRKGLGRQKRSTTAVPGGPTFARNLPFVQRDFHPFSDAEALRIF